MAEVSLRDVVEALDMQSDEALVYLNRITGEIVRISDEERLLVEEDDQDDDLPDWQREILPKIREALESEDFLQLPDRFEIHEWSIMQRFADSQKDAGCREALNQAIHGAGAFRFFRATVHRLGIEDAWYRFRESAFEKIAKDWLEANGISYR